jgi:hypothetical protein
MTTDDAFRFARQIALPQIGPDGQARICAARVLVIGGDLAAETAARYLEAGGVGSVRQIEALPAGGEGWLAALEGADLRADLIVRSGFDDDALLGAAARLGLPAVIVRSSRARIDLLSFPRRPPDPDAALEIPPQRAVPAEDGAAAVLAGALAAAEALTRLARGGADLTGRTAGGIRHLRLPLDGGDPLAQPIGAP